MTSGDEPTLDPTMLDSLAGDEAAGAAGIVAEIVGIFREDVTARVASLRAAANVGDAETVRKLAHAIKGSSGTIGARRLCALAESLERAPDASGASDVSLEIEREFARACAAIDARLR